MALCGRKRLDVSEVHIRLGSGKKKQGKTQLWCFNFASDPVPSENPD